MIMLLISTYKSFCVALRRMNFESGRRPAAPLFLLFAQKKEGKEKGTLLSPDRCASCRSRREKNSARCASNTFSLHPWSAAMLAGDRRDAGVNVPGP
jgi:hypothetical protein